LHATAQLAMSTHHRFRALVILLPFGLVLGCSERRGEPDYSDIIRDACEAACPITTECVADPLYASTEECIEMCSSHYDEDELNQCDSRGFEFDFCTGTLTCEEYQEYVMAILGGEPPPSNFNCMAEYEGFLACDSTQPFEEPDR
jgi:hypothetical protein